MKKWKILNDSDKQSNASSKYHKSRVELTMNNQQKMLSRAYIPLRRTKGADSFLGKPKSSKNIQSASSTQIFPLSYTQKYIKCFDSCSNQSNKKKMKTEFGDEMFGLGFESLQQIQQNHMRQNGYPQTTQRGRTKTIQREKKQLLSEQKAQGQTERIFNKQASISLRHEIDVMSLSTPFKKKQSSNISLENIKEYVTNLSKQQQQLRQQIKKQLIQFQQILEQQNRKWNAYFEQIEANQNQKQSEQAMIKDIMKEYQQYKQKTDELEQQKQVFLQTLIRMAPV